MALLPSLLERLRSLVPPGWFAGVAPVRDTMLGGMADCADQAHALIDYAKAQTRIATQTGFWLDLTAYDFFGMRFRRRKAERDEAFQLRLRKEIIRPRATRPALIQALTDLTGHAPKIIEPWDPYDCGAYDDPTGAIAYAGSDFVPLHVSGYDDPTGGYDAPGNLSYDLPTGPSGNTSPGAGCWGEPERICQLFVTAYRPNNGDLDGLSVYDFGQDGTDVGPNLAYIDDDLVRPVISDAEIYAAVAPTQAAGVTAWTRIGVAS